jgi:transcriptional regulator
MFIFSCQEIPVEIRQKSGLTLKGIMERSFSTFNDDNISYFKNKILENYSDANNTIKRITSILINTFITLDGIEQWQDLLNFLMSNLSNAKNYEMSMETIQIILEDSGNYIEEKYLSVNKFFYLKILFKIF